MPRYTRCPYKLMARDSRSSHNQSPLYHSPLNQSPLNPARYASRSRTRSTRHALPNNKYRKAMRKDNIPLRKTIAQRRICKQPLPQPSPQPRGKRRGQEQLAPISASLRQVLPEHHDRVAFIYNKIRILALPLKSIRPRLPSSDRYEVEMGVVRLEYRKSAFQSLVRRIHSDSLPRQTQLIRVDVKTLQAILEHDIPVLYNAHIPYKVDISTMPITKAWSSKLRRDIFQPLIDTFDLDLDPQDDSIPWAVHRDSMLKFTRDQFAVIEVQPP